MISHPKRWLTRLDGHAIVVLAVLLAAAVMRFHDLDRTGLWLDESYSWYQASLSFEDIYQESANSPHPPLHNYLAWPWVRMFGDSETAMRSLPAMLGTINVLLLYVTARLIWCRKIALTAMTILAFSAFHIWFSQEFRTYALFSLAATAYMYSVFRMLIRPGSASYVLNMAAGLALLFSHVFGSFLFAGVNLYLAAAWLLGRRDIQFDYRKWLLVQAVVIAVFGRWVYILLMNSRTASIHWIPELTVYGFFSQLSSVFNGPLAALMLCSLSLFALYQAFLRPEPDSGIPAAGSEGRWACELLTVWAAFPVFLTTVLSILVMPLFINRYMILCLPPVCLLASRGLYLLKGYRALHTGALILLVLGLSFEIWRIEHRDREQYSSLISEVQACYGAGDLVVAMPGTTIRAIRYYWRDPGVDFRQLDGPSGLPPLLREGKPVWLIIRKANFPAIRDLLTLDAAESGISGFIDAFGVESWLFSPQRPSGPGMQPSAPGCHLKAESSRM